MKTDVLSDVLRGVRLTGAAYFDFELSSPWVREAPPARELAGLVMSGAQRVIEYHLIARGSCWGQAIGVGEPIRLHEGDVILFPRGDAHVISSEPGMRERVDIAAFPHPSTPLPVFYEVGGGGPDRARIVCCFLGCDQRPYNPLLGALPPVIHLSAGTQPAAAWLGQLMSTAATESRSARPGGENVLARLSELMFVETIRQYLAAMPLSEAGWLAGLRDPIVGHALAALHRQPAASWTVERLARDVAISRSVLAERFTAIVGQPPMQYLALWRMQLASRLLVEGRPLAEIATAVGYESDASFSRTFKKLVGDSPAAWRQSQTRRSTQSTRSTQS